MLFPVYAMDVFDNRFVYFAGGGGYEIPNQIQGYRLTSGKKQVDLPEICTVVTDPAMVNYMVIT